MWVAPDFQLPRLVGQSLSRIGQLQLTDRAPAVSKRIRFFVPKSFNPAVTLPLRLIRHAQSARYFMHLVISRLCHADYAVLNRDYVRADLGRRLADNLNDALLDAGELQRVHDRWKNPVGYLPGEQYANDALVPFYPTDPVLIDRVTKTQARIEEYHRQQQSRRERPADAHWRGWQNRLRVDARRANKTLKQLGRSNAFGIQGLNILHIRERNLRYHIDAYGRVHNSISSLDRRLRASLKLGKEQLVNVDISNSQPLFLALVLSSQNPHQRAKQWVVSMDTLVPALSPPFEQTSFEREFLESASSGKLYDLLVLDTGLSRERVKTKVMSDVFGKRFDKRGRYPSIVENSFRRRWPNVYRFIRKFNAVADDHGALLKFLQRVESQFVINGVGGRLAGTDGAFLSLHDGIFAGRSHVDQVIQAMGDEAAAWGCRLPLKIEHENRQRRIEVGLLAT